ncbi:uncharacterized protein F4812DRAFT_450284 [Daldinia caldariorum]|uniref:uncharacterized protein n=1 Tax=Daldinia caldariorum TaxID=326644 RepID=UPI00200825CB|nr:uncharacterized protein F4812DRAFT_450284 [Daldinia caldariorum]KAI1469877.1 hypothetical protein F4812DRAFT_450284 [Daldinia caldariorum]
MNADHRQLCKFNSPDDPNYKTLRNTLHTAADMLRSSPPWNLATSQTQVNLTYAPEGLSKDLINQRLRSFLGVDDTLEDELQILQILREPGTCEWFSEAKSFTSWKPASGKSVLSSHVIEQVKYLGAFCSYFFFKQKEASKSTLGDCLRSLAFQMAMQDDQVADKLLQLEGEGVTWDITDELSVWRRLFINGVFKLPSISQHFWIIDGVDECANFNSLFTKRILATLPRDIRLFATSRHLEEIGRLVLQELETAWTREAMDAVLNEVPVDLKDMYRRMLQSMEKDKRRVKLAQSILTWAVLACRPLSVDELRVAVKLDVNETLQNMSKAIPSLCHQLVFVDNTDRPLAPLRRKSSGFRGFAKPDDGLSPDLSLLDYAASYFSEHIYQGTSREDIVMSELCTFLKSKNILSWIEHAADNGNLGDITRTATNLRAYLGRRMKYLSPMDPSAYFLDCWVTDLIRVTAKFRSQLLACPSSIHYIIPSFCPSESIISRTFANSARPWAITVKGIRPTTWARVTALSHGSQYFAVGLSTGQISLFDPHSVQCVTKIAHPERVKMLGFSNDGEYLASSGAKTLVVWQLKSKTKKFSHPISESELIAFAFLSDDEFLCAFASGELTKWCLDTGRHETISWGGMYDKDIFCTPDIPDQPPSRAALFATGETVLLAVGYRNHPIFIWNALDNGIDDMTFNPNPEITALVVSYSDGRLYLFDYITMMPTFTRPNVYANSIACSPNGHSLVTGSTGGVIEVFEFDQDHGGNIVLVPIYSIQSLEDSIRSIAFSPDGLRFVDIHDRQCRIWAPTALLRKDNELESVSDIIAPPLKMVGMLEPMTPEVTSNLAISPNGSYIIAGKSNGDVLVFSAVDGKELGVLYRHGRGVSIVNVALREAHNLFISADDSGRLLVVELAEPILVSSVPQQLPTARITMDHRFGAAIVNLLVNPTSDRLLISGRNTDDFCDLLSGKVLGSISHIDGGVTSTPNRNISDIRDASTSAAAFQHPTNESWFVLILAGTARIFCWSNFQELTTSNGVPLQTPPTAVESLLPTQLQATKPLTMRSSSYYVGQGFVLELLRSSPPRLYVWPVSTFDPQTTPLEHPAQLPKELSLSSINAEILAVLGIVGQSTVLLVDVNLWVYSIELHPKQARPPGRTSFSSETKIIQDSTTQQIPPVLRRRHFFALSEWRTINGELRCAVAQRSGSPEFFFASEDHIIVVQGGLEFSEVMTIDHVRGTEASMK